MTVKEAIEAINGAEIMSLNTPIRKLQLAVVTLISAAKRASIYDEKLIEGKMVEIPDCKKCVYNDGIAYWHQCEHCLGEARNNFVAKEEVHHG